MGDHVNLHKFLRGSNPSDHSLGDKTTSGFTVQGPENVRTTEVNASRKPCSEVADVTKA